MTMLPAQCRSGHARPSRPRWVPAVVVGVVMMAALSVSTGTASAVTTASPSPASTSTPGYTTPTTHSYDDRDDEPRLDRTPLWIVLGVAGAGLLTVVIILARMGPAGRHG